jgi:hypothetical protein
MDGYTVEEAAEVLGIPQGRVWELIARGVLSGAAEGRADMRVFLKPSAAERPGGVGNGGGELGDDGGKGASAIEASPFRELLTEFRNLTERYGQALLALGEARGEVAALRSRVEVLEARMDMRLPLRAASTVAWEMPDRYAAEHAPAERAPAEPPAEPQPEPMPLHPPDVPSQPTSGPPDASPAPETGLSHAETADHERAAAERTDAGEVPVEAAPEPDEPRPPTADEVPEVPVVVQVEAPEAEAADAATIDAETTDQPKRRVSGGRAAVAGLAEALARAEDPTLADLPGAREAAEALAAFQRETEPAAETEPAPRADPGEVEEVAAPEEVAAVEEQASLQDEPEPAEPTDREEPAHELVASEEAEEPTPPEERQAAFAPPMAELEAEPPATASEIETEPEPTDAPEPPSVYSTEVVEPDWFADGDFTWLDASSLEGETAEPAAAPEADAEAEHLDREREAPAAEAIQEAFHEPGQIAPETQAAPPEAEHLDREEEAPTAEAIQEAFDHADAASSTEAAPAWPESDRPPITGSGGVGFGLFRADEGRQRAQSTGSGTAAAGAPEVEAAQEEALLWFGDEFEAADELEVAAPGWRDQERLEAAPAAGVALDETQEEAPSDEQIDRLADEGWGSDEVEAIRSYLGRAGVAGTESPAQRAAEEPTTEGAAEPASQPGADPMPPPGLDQDWLRGRRGPAATAYRRLRRLFNS